MQEYKESFELCKITFLTNACEYCRGTCTHHGWLESANQS